jgi:hypothetical protein
MALMSLSDLFPVTLDCLSDDSMSIAVKIADLLLKVCPIVFNDRQLPS